MSTTGLIDEGKGNGFSGMRQLVPPLKSSAGYSIWAVQMRSLFETKKELYSLVFDPQAYADVSAVAQNAEHKARQDHLRKLNTQARSLIFYGLGQGIIENVINIESAYKTWQYLHKVYGGSSIGSKINLLNELASMSQGARTLDVYLAHFNQVTAKLQSTGHKGSPVSNSNYLIRGLSSKYRFYKPILYETVSRLDNPNEEHLMVATLMDKIRTAEHQTDSYSYSVYNQRRQGDST